jgi:hypothetical protein
MESVKSTGLFPMVTGVMFYEQNDYKWKFAFTDNGSLPLAGDGSQLSLSATMRTPEGLMNLK